MSQPACIGEPVSWLRLESYALDGGDAQVAEHVERCPACRGCLDEIRGDSVALPALPATVAAPRRRWWTWTAPAFALAAAAALIFLLVRPRPEPREDTVAIKGVGEVVVDVVRERGGVITESARTFAPGDRWKVVVTCPPGAGAYLDVTVFEVGNRAVEDHPIDVAHVTCGNRVYLPGAFELTGTRPNRVCVRVGAYNPPARIGDTDLACVTVSPQ